MATNEGYFLPSTILTGTNGTSFNSPNHYINNAQSLEPLGIPENERKAAEELTVDQLTGTIVLVDISSGSDNELSKNNGIPSPDLPVTDFSDSSNAMVRAEDIETVADQIDNGVWVVAHFGWSQFYTAGIEDWDELPYVNALNHPGFTEEAIDKPLEIMDRKRVKIASIAADSLSTDSGQGAKGTDHN